MILIYYYATEYLHAMPESRGPRSKIYRSEQVPNAFVKSLSTTLAIINNLSKFYSTFCFLSTYSNRYSLGNKNCAVLISHISTSDAIFFQNYSRGEVPLKVVADRSICKMSIFSSNP